MSLEISRFFDSSHHKEPDPSHIEFVEKSREFILGKYLWKPVAVHVRRGFLNWVHEQTNGREVPPYYGILNPFNEDRNIVLFPWYRSQDVDEVMGKLIRDGGLDGFLGGISDGNLGPRIFMHSNHKLVIPSSELSSMGNATMFK